MPADEQRAPITERFNCSAPFLNHIRKQNTRVMLYLLSGVRLFGKVREFDTNSLIFFGNAENDAPVEQLIMRSAIASIVPVQERS